MNQISVFMRNTHKLLILHKNEPNCYFTKKRVFLVVFGHFVKILPFFEPNRTLHGSKNFTLIL